MNYMMAHLTAADLFVAFFNVLPQLMWDITGRFQGNDVMCRSVTYLQLVAMYASSYVLVATGLDRHSAICRPLNSITWSARRSKILVSVAWLLAFLFALPQVFIFSYRWDSRGSLNCWAVFQPSWTMRIYVVWVALSIYAIPVAILLVTYTLLCRAVWTSFQTGVDLGRRMERKKFSLTSLTSSFRSTSTKTSSLLRGRRPFLKNHFRSRTVEQLEKIERANGVEMEVLIPIGNQEIKTHYQQQQQQHPQQQHQQPLQPNNVSNDEGCNSDDKMSHKPQVITSIVTFKLPEKSFESDRRCSGHFHRNAKLSSAGASGFFGRNSKVKIRSETFTASPNAKSDLNEDFPQVAPKQNGKSKTEDETIKDVLDTCLPDQTKRGFTLSKKKSQMSRAKIRTVKLTVIINISYLLCWCPFFFTQLWAALDAEAPYESSGMTITTLLASLNSCMNPLIFIFFVHIQRDKKGRVK